MKTAHAVPHESRQYYIRQIERLVGKNYALVRKELARLESFGLLTSEAKGNQTYYAVNQDFFLYPELQRLVLKTEGVAQALKERLGEIGDVECIFIYGSFAKGSAGAKSDIDLFIVGDVDEDRADPGAPAHQDGAGVGVGKGRDDGIPNGDEESSSCSDEPVEVGGTAWNVEDSPASCRDDLGQRWLTHTCLEPDSR